MIMETVKQRYGSLIKVKSQYEERYIILHKHTFPEVLNQIHRSNIRNYSIYLKDGVLFSYFEYVGDDFDKDMESMAQNEATRDWWKLTDPMQEPFESRKKGEWWASLDEVYHFGDKQVPSYQAQKYAYVAHTEIAEPTPSFEPDLNGLLLQNFSVFRLNAKLYLYLEDAADAALQQTERYHAALHSVLLSLKPESDCTDCHPMRQVFLFD